MSYTMLRLKLNFDDWILKIDQIKVAFGECFRLDGFKILYKLDLNFVYPKNQVSSR